jgi:NmrA-like family
MQNLQSNIKSFLPGIISLATAFAASAASGDSSITVIGANGRTGRKVVNVSLKKGLKTFAVTRTGDLLDETIPKSGKLVSLAADVTDSTSFEALRAALKSRSQLNPNLSQLNPNLSQLNPNLTQINPDFSQ